MAMPRVLEKFPNAKLVIVGLGGMKEYLSSLVNRLKLDDAVKFCFEFISEPDRIAYYASCDVAVFPSLYEPFGIVALEAMSMGKPVVVGAAGVSGMREIVIPTGPEQCGYHVNPSDPSDIAWALISLFQDPQRMKHFGKNSRKRVINEFTWEIAAKTTEKYYSLVLNKQNIMP